MSSRAARSRRVAGRLDLENPAEQAICREGLAPLVERLSKLDPSHAQAMDTSNPQRVIRAWKCVVSGKPFSSFRLWSSTGPGTCFCGTDPDRAELRAHRRQGARHDGRWMVGETKALLLHRFENALNIKIKSCLTSRRPFDEGTSFGLFITHTRRDLPNATATWFKKDPATTWFAYDNENREDALRRAVEHAMQEVQRLQGTPLHS